MANNSDQTYSKEEAARRAEAALRAAFRTPPKPMKGIPRKRPKVQRKATKKAADR